MILLQGLDPQQPCLLIAQVWRGPHYGESNITLLTEVGKIKLIFRSSDVNKETGNGIHLTDGEKAAGTHHDNQFLL